MGIFEFDMATLGQYTLIAMHQSTFVFNWLGSILVLASIPWLANIRQPAASW